MAAGGSDIRFCVAPEDFEKSDRGKHFTDG